MVNNHPIKQNIVNIVNPTNKFKIILYYYLFKPTVEFKYIIVTITNNRTRNAGEPYVKN